MIAAEMTYSISSGDTEVFLSESPEEFITIVDTAFLNTWLISKEDLDSLVGYLAVSYPNVIVESMMFSSTFLKCVEVPKQEYPQ